MNQGVSQFLDFYGGELMREVKPPGSTDPSDASQAEPKKKKLPAWAIVLAVIAFIIFNCVFALFAKRIGIGTNN